MSTLGTIVATDKNTGLRVVFHVASEDIGLTFRRPDIEEWHHSCHPSIRKTEQGFIAELAHIENGRFCDANFEEKKHFAN